jgi:hypothetical protein
MQQALLLGQSSGGHAHNKRFAQHLQDNKQPAQRQHTVTAAVTVWQIAALHIYRMTCTHSQPLQVANADCACC